MKATITKRSLKIQFRYEKQVYSLPTIDVPTFELTKADLYDLLADDRYAPVVVRLINSQCHISFSSRAGERILKDAGYKTPDDAKANVREVAEKGIDFLKEVQLHALKLAERQAKGAKVDKIQELIREKWSSSTKKAEFLQRLNLPVSLIEATAEEVEAAYIAQRDNAEEWL